MMNVFIQCMLASLALCVDARLIYKKVPFCRMSQEEHQHHPLSCGKKVKKTIFTEGQTKTAVFYRESI
jgi:hypothetical protein